MRDLGIWERGSGEEWVLNIWKEAKGKVSIVYDARKSVTMEEERENTCQ